MKFCRPCKKIRFFTLMELIVSMAVFSILILLLMQIFSSTQNVWTRTYRKSSIQDTARIILDSMENDLKSWTRNPDSGTSSQQWFYVSSLPTDKNNKDYGANGVADNVEKTPFELVFLTDSGSKQTLVRYGTAVLKTGYRLGCLRRKTSDDDPTDTADDYSKFHDSGSRPAADGDLLATNVYSLKIDARTKNGVKANGSTTIAPDYLLITLRLMDEDMVETYLDLKDFADNPSDGTTQANIQKNNIHTFQRVVILN